MSRLAWILLGICLLVMPACGVGNGQTGTRWLRHRKPLRWLLPRARFSRLAPPATTYTLTPERRAKAIAYSRSQYILYFFGTLFSIGIYLLLWHAGIAVKFREWARKVSRRHFVQCLIFVPLFVAAAMLLNLPLDFYSGYVLEHRFGLSTQGFASWLGDWGKSLAHRGGDGRYRWPGYSMRSSAAARAAGGSTSGWRRFLSS